MRLVVYFCFSFVNSVKIIKKQTYGRSWEKLLLCL
jgi:hypothetical protein